MSGYVDAGSWQRTPPDSYSSNTDQDILDWDDRTWHSNSHMMPQPCAFNQAGDLPPGNDCSFEQVLPSPERPVYHQMVPARPQKHFEPKVSVSQQPSFRAQTSSQSIPAHNKLPIPAGGPRSSRSSDSRQGPTCWCEECGRGFKREHGEYTGYEQSLRFCSRCKSGVLTNTLTCHLDLNRHIEADHGQFCFQCLDCEYRYPRKDKLLRHCRIHRPSQGFQRVRR